MDYLSIFSGPIESIPQELVVPAQLVGGIFVVAVLVTAFRLFKKRLMVSAGEFPQEVDQQPPVSLWNVLRTHEPYQHRQAIVAWLTVITLPLLLLKLGAMINDIPPAGDGYGRSITCGDDQYIFMEVKSTPPTPEDIRRGESMTMTDTGYIYKNSARLHNAIMQEDIKKTGWWYLPVAAPKLNCDRIYVTNIGYGHVYEGIYMLDLKARTITRTIDSSLFNKDLMPRINPVVPEQVVSPDGESVLTLSHEGQGEGNCNFRSIQSLNLRTGVAIPVVHLSENESLSALPSKKQGYNECLKIDFGWKSDKEVYFDVFDSSVGTGARLGTIEFPFRGRKYVTISDHAALDHVPNTSNSQVVTPTTASSTPTDNQPSSEDVSSCYEKFPNNKLREELKKYGHCQSAADCTVVHGTRCGYQSGYATNKEDLTTVLPLINSCSGGFCDELTDGTLPQVECVNNRCVFSH